MKFLPIIFVFLLFFGCSYVLTKNKNKNETVSNISQSTDKSALESSNYIETGVYYLRYFNFEHANSTMREAHLEFMSNAGKRSIQVLLLPGETVSSSFCNNKITVKFDDFTSLDYNIATITVDYLGKSTLFNLSREDKSALQFSCSGINEIKKLFDARKESNHIFVGEKEFTLENDLMVDSSCELGKRYDNITIRHQDWYSNKFDDQPYIRRYMFRPNTIFCTSESMYTLEEDVDSKQCYTILGKRNSNTVGCKNLEGLIGSEPENNNN